MLSRKYMHIRQLLQLLLDKPVYNILYIYCVMCIYYHIVAMNELYIHITIENNNILKIEPFVKVYT